MITAEVAKDIVGIDPNCFLTGSVMKAKAERELYEAVRKLDSFADEIRRECADRLEAWWLDDDTELSMALDENINAMRAAIMGKESLE